MEDRLGPNPLVLGLQKLDVMTWVFAIPALFLAPRHSKGKQCAMAECI
jgi:hypothetical protein